MSSNNEDKRGHPPNQFGDKRTIEISKANPSYRCGFCRRYEINSIEWGYMLKLDDIVVHHFCLLFSALAEQLGNDNEGIHGFMPTQIHKEIRRGNRLRCMYCKKSNATIGCGVARCPSSFHYSCGYEAGCLFQFFGQFLAFCPKHKTKQKIPSQVCRECPICMVDTERDEEVWTPCCGKRIFHRRCLMYSAKAAGYFFKCPLCNSNSPKFLQVMRANGVYIPQQDAAWELEPNAFQELLTNYSRCDAKRCLCPDGREFDGKNNKEWSLVRCSSCGASATHVKCSNLKFLKWKCRGCRKVFKKSGLQKSLENEGLSSGTDSGESSASDSCHEESSEEEVIRNLPFVSRVIKSQRLSRPVELELGMIKISSCVKTDEPSLLSLCDKKDERKCESDVNWKYFHSMSKSMPPSPSSESELTEESQLGKREYVDIEDKKHARKIPLLGYTQPEDFIMLLKSRRDNAIFECDSPKLDPAWAEGNNQRLKRLSAFLRSKSLARKEARAEARRIENAPQTCIVEFMEENRFRSLEGEFIRIEHEANDIGIENLAGISKIDTVSTRTFVSSISIPSSLHQDSRVEEENLFSSFGCCGRIRGNLKAPLSLLAIRTQRNKLDEVRRRFHALAFQSDSDKIHSLQLKK